MNKIKDGYCFHSFLGKETKSNISEGQESRLGGRIPLYLPPTSWPFTVHSFTEQFQRELLML